MDPSSAERRSVRKSLRTSFTPGPRERARRVLLRARQASHLPALVTGGILDRPVFVIGAPRSGTSVLFSALTASPEIAHWPGEAHEVWEADHHPSLIGWTSNALDASDATPDVAGRIRREFLLVAGTRKRLVEKTPRNSLRVAFIDAIFPDASFVFIKRDGRDNVNSLINAWRTPRYRTYVLPERHSIPGPDPKWWKFVLYPGWRADLDGPLEVVCARQWVVSNEHALAAAEHIEPRRWVEVRYEDLVSSPVVEIGRVLDAVGIPYDAATRRRAAALGDTPINVVTPPERGKWRRENPREIEAILPLIAPTMTKLGYSIDED